MNIRSIFCQPLERPTLPNPAYAMRQKLASATMLAVLSSTAFGYLNCSKSPPPPTGEATSLSAIKVTVKPGGPLVMQSATAELNFLPTGYVHALMLSRGAFRNLYVYGYDTREGYAVEKDGKMYYAFFAPDPAKLWQGEVELRGLRPGRYRIVDYENGKDLGLLDSQQPKLKTEFRHHLLLEASSQ